MKRVISFLLASLGLASTFAQNGTGFVGDGYYRVCNYATKRYIYVTDNKDYYDMSHDAGDFQAIQLWKDITRAVPDPASVIYIDETDYGFDLRAQGTGTYSLTGRYMHVTKQRNGTYEVSATAKGVTKYLSDSEQSSSEQGTMSTSGTGDYRKWIVDKLTTDHATNYFGIKPTIQLNGKYYQPFYAAFPFKTASSDMHVYYISQVEWDLALLQEIEGEIPANTPVIIECASDNPSQNRLELLTSSSAKVTGNKLSGLYFCNGMRPKESVDAYTKFDGATMRIFSVNDGKLVLTNDAPERLKEIKTIDWSTNKVVKVKSLPANTSYFKTNVNTPGVIELTTDPTVIADGIADINAESKAAQGVYTLSGTQLRADNSINGLPAGLYIVGGKKVIKN